VSIPLSYLWACFVLVFPNVVLNFRNEIVNLVLFKVPRKVRARQSVHVIGGASKLTRCVKS
jgi:hypothetical protein